jgi:hypothetical protein
MAAKLEAAYALRAHLRRLAVSARVRDCGRRAITPAPTLEVRQAQSGERQAWFAGVLRCGRQHSCPVCGARRAAHRAQELTDLQRADLGTAMTLTLESAKRGPREVRLEAGAWRMLTLTLRHHRGQALAALIDQLFVAWRSTRATRSVREVFERRVSASARALEVTWSERAGWHPHIHLMIRTSAWTDDEKRTLEREWLARVPGLAGVAIAWSDTPAEYLAKLGAEVAGVAKKAKRGHYSGWQIARAALASASFAVLWSEYQRAMHGRRILELDERAKALASLAPAPEPFARTWTIELYSEEYSELARLEREDPLALWLVLDCVCASGCDPPHELAIYLADNLGRKERRLAA